MSIVKSPLIRERLRSEREIASEVTGRLEERRFAPTGADPLKDGLVQVFARYCEILSERLNRVPESHHHAFISMLSAAPAPAVPSRVPLSFKPVASAQNITAVVPRFTQVSGPPENGTEAAIFETQHDLSLVQAELKQAMAVDTQRLIHANVSDIVSTEAMAGFTKSFLLADATPLERAMHISQPEIIGLEKLSRLRLRVNLDQAVALPHGYEIEWSTQSGTVLRPESDTTDSLTRSGELVFIPPEEWPSWTIIEETAPWLTCRLRPAASPWLLANADPEYYGRITGIEISGDTTLTDVPPIGAFNGGIPLDISRDFFPLGERPRFGEVFYILSESFALPGTRVVIDIKLTNPAGAVDSPIPTVSRKGNPRVRWEAYTKRGWVTLDCIDRTRSLTQDGEIELSMPGDTETTAINAITGGWLRARLVSGNYTADNIPETPAGFPPMNPPSIATIHIASIKEFGPLGPKYLVTENGLEYQKADSASFNPFPAPNEQGFMLYLGFKARKTALAGRALSLYAVTCNEGRRIFCRDSHKGVEEMKAAPRWHARTETGWRECTVTDSTQGFSNPGSIEFHMPDDISEWHDSTIDPKQPLFWVRIAWDTPVTNDSPKIDQQPCLRRLSLNTILATQTLRLTDELLGSSNGRPKQIFHALRKPIIGDVKLQVREPGGQAHNRPETRPDEESLYSFGLVKISTLPSDEEWVTWSEVENFSSSDSHDRHFILDRLTGRISFGDGKNGGIPAAGANNIRLHEYHTGGGRRGNKPAGTVVQLRTTIPYVDSVTNPAPAAGGQDQESRDSLIRGATARVRHRDRAVCMDDYADLARKASPEVAYAACAPLRDLQRDSEMDNEIRPGVVSVIVVPHNSEPRPQPSFELLTNVKAFLDRHRPVAVDLIVLGPEYVQVGVTADIVWKADYSLADAVAECEKCLNDFLHPVTGGLEGQGWQFGQLPHASDVYPLLGDIEGLDHIRSLELRHEEERPGLLRTRNFLISSGKHEIRIC